jgi:hypothetical protein
VTFGGTNWLREKLYGDTATQNHEGAFYQGGEVAGEVATSLLPTGAFKGAKWAQQAVGGYNKARNIYDRFQDVSSKVGSINNILNGCGGLEDLQNLAGGSLNPLGQIKQPSTVLGIASGGGNPKINVRHVFHGEINKRGSAVGFHHEGSIGSQNYGRIVPGTKTPLNPNGVYKANVEVFNSNTGNWTAKGPQSSFYPQNWSRGRVLNETRSAFQNQTLVKGNYWEGTSPSGVKIGGYLDKKGDINTSFPIY